MNIEPWQMGPLILIAVGGLIIMVSVVGFGIFLLFAGK